MLVVHAQGIGAGRLQLCAGRLLVLSDQLFAAAGIAGDRGGRDRRIRRYPTRVDEGAHEQQKRRGMATWVGDALARTQLRTLPQRQLRQAKGPARSNAVGRAGVDDAGVGVLHPLRGLAGRHIGQTQKNDICGVQQALALCRVFAKFRGNGQDVDVIALGQHLMDAQPCGAFLTVNKYLNSHGFASHAARTNLKVQAYGAIAR